MGRHSAPDDERDVRPAVWIVEAPAERRPQPARHARADDRDAPPPLLLQLDKPSAAVRAEDVATEQATERAAQQAAEQVTERITPPDPVAAAPAASEPGTEPGTD